MFFAISQFHARPGSVDPRNASALVSLNGRLTPRSEALVSVFDAGFLYGDGLCEAARITEGRIGFLDAHVQRLWNGARMLRIDPGLSQQDLIDRVFDCLDANGMQDGADIRVVLTRGAPALQGEAPSGATLLIAPEWRGFEQEAMASGLALFTVHQRAAGPAALDGRLGSLSQVQRVLAALQARGAGADEALMLDDRGFVGGCASADLFVVTNGEVSTSACGHGPAGVTRSAILRAARRAGVPSFEKDLSLLDLYSADEIFLACDLRDLMPVRLVDGREIGEKSGDFDDASGPMTRWLRDLYRELQNEESRGR